MIKRICVAALAAWFLAALPVSAQSPRHDSTASSAKDKAKAAKKRRTSNLLKTLHKRVDSVEFDESSFGEVVEWLREQGDINVVPVWRALRVEGVDEESTVTLLLRDASVVDVLDEIVAQLSEEGKVTYRGVGNRLRISTVDDFNRKLYTMVYDVTDILQRVPDFGQSAPEIDLERVAALGGSQGQGGAQQSIFTTQGGREQSEVGQQAEQRLEERLEELRETIMAVIEPDFWDEAGGPGAIRAYNRHMIVRASIEIHELIAGQFAFAGK